MKNKIYYLGFICCTLVILGCISKLQHWPMANILLLSGLGLFVLAFLPVSLISSYKANPNPKALVLYWMAFVCASSQCIGATFAIYHWPGTHLITIITIPLPFVLFLPAYLFFNRNNTYVNYKNLVFVMLFLAYMSVMHVALTLNTSYSVLNEALSISESNQQTANYTHTLSDNYKSSIKDSAKIRVARTISETSGALCQTIDKLKLETLQSIDPQNAKCIDASGNVDLNNVKGLHEKEHSYRSEFQSKVLQLKNDLNTLRKSMLAIVGDTSATGIFIAEILNTKTMYGKDWATHTFRGLPLAFTIEELDRIKKNVRMAELETIETFL